MPPDSPAPPPSSSQLLHGWCGTGWEKKGKIFLAWRPCPRVCFCSGQSYHSSWLGFSLEDCFEGSLEPPLLGMPPTVISFLDRASSDWLPGTPYSRTTSTGSHCPLPFCPSSKSPLFLGWSPRKPRLRADRVHRARLILPSSGQPGWHPSCKVSQAWVPPSL